MSYYVIAENSVDETFHLTLLPEFDILDSDVEHFLNDVKYLSTEYSSFQIIPEAEDEFFSDDDVIHVLKVKKTEDIVKMHDDLMSFAVNYGVVFDNVDYVGDGFTPHVSGADMRTVLPVFDRLSVSYFDGESFVILGSFDLNNSV